MKRTYLLRFNQINRDTFEAIRRGKKQVETRAATARYRKIQPGDELIFSCAGKKFKKIVRRTQVFKSIKAMLNKYKVKDINPFVSSAKELQTIYYSYPGYREKIKKFGLVAWELK